MFKAFPPTYPAKKNPEMKDITYINVKMLNGSDGMIMYLTMNTLLEEDRAPARQSENLLIFLMAMKTRSATNPSTREMRRTRTP